jgi:molecular chaperone GrpE
MQRSDVGECDVKDRTSAIMDDKSEPSETEPSEKGATAGATVDADEIQRQRDDYYDRLLRKTAEFDNYRKRVERDRQSMSDGVTAEVVRDLLPLVDDLERALKSDPGVQGAEPYRKGVELIHRRLLEILRKRGVRPIDALGADFDPHLHEAVSYEHAEGRRDGEIIDELARGYKLGERLLRPSMVKVAKGE